MALLGTISLAAAPVTEKWTAVSSPFFTVLTPAKADAARAWAIELERFRLALQLVVNVPESRLRPVTVVLFPNDAAMRPFKPLENGQPQAISGLFVNFCDSHMIQLSLDGKPAQTRHTIFHEAVHWYSNAGEGELPLWLEEGVAEVYSTFSIGKDGSGSFGDVIPSHLKLLAKDKQWSIAQLIGTTRSSLEYNEGTRASRFYAGSWLAVHYLLFSQGPAGRASILRYLELRQRFGDTPEAFERAFGVNYAGFQAQLQRYLQGGKYQVQRLNLPASEIERQLSTRAATGAEVDLALGTLLVGSRPEARAQGTARVKRAADQSPSDPVPWQVLGEVALAGENYPEAEASFERAIAAGSTSYFAFYGLGACRTHKMKSSAGEYDRAAATHAAGDFRRALELNPRFVPACEGLAGIMYVVDTVDPKDRERLEEGARLAPDNLIIDVGLASIDLRAGRETAGQRRLDLVLQAATDRDAKTRELAQEIREVHAWNSLIPKLEKLFAARNYDEALHQIDAARANFSDPQVLTLLDQNRQVALAFSQIEKAVALANHGNASDAKKLLHQVQESAAGEPAKAEARRLLEEIDR